MGETVVWFIFLAGVTIALIAYLISLDKLAKLYRPWRLRLICARMSANAMMSYIDKETGEFYFAQLMDDAGAPLAALLYKDQYCLPRKGEFLELEFTDYVDRKGKGYAVMDRLSWRRIRNPFELIFRHKKQIWQNDPRNVCRFFWIDGESIRVKNDIYLTYDAIHSIYGLVGRRGLNVASRLR
jgi:hypothetical protein